jgi:hypothetical protein
MVCYFNIKRNEIDIFILIFDIVLDLCFANIVCGKHGRCVHTLSDIKCSCRFLFGGLYCETSM